ncbi:GTP 3',8-cyclase MoaA [Rhodococcus sp. 14-2496-1d]|uniref:GTP 3',8-cyclase MoaA n=1 Tax=Rhodococcus sp. 14-2496-1d TaxID=2023146 RepID=UPI000B9B092D|nr:GTP 3',8-cyclase MoaA [Rhodococcus sp. 14-2496-1d]OZF25739.1 GTP 3',8-cyclase MoaA [Rhodococcus sp. 14-2496-1d]
MSSTALGLPTLRGVTPVSDRPDADGLIDRFGRTATDLRISLTDRCNLRCTYCMPAEGLDWQPADQLLSTAELQRLIRIAVDDLGVEEIRFTGGEPLLRADLPELVSFAAALHPRPSISLTTNGLGLHRKAHLLADAGVDRINVSLDSIDRDVYAAITRRDRLDDVLTGLRAAREAGLHPIKINAVLIREVNDSGVGDLLDYCLREGFELRIIEQMPLDAGHRWQRSEMITAAEIHSLLGERHDLTVDPTPRGAAPAQRWLVDGGPAAVGVIASVTEPFCGDCDRVRLTADGRVRSCLFAGEETDLMSLLRGLSQNAADTDSEIAARWRDAMWTKQPGHGIDDPAFLQPARPMSAIGG